MLTNWLGYLLLAGVAVPAAAARPAAGLEAGHRRACRCWARRCWRRRSPTSRPAPSRGAAAGRCAATSSSCRRCRMALAAARRVAAQLAADRRRSSGCCCSRSVPYPTVLAVLLVAAVAGVITHVPAGLGVLEAVFVALLSHRAAERASCSARCWPTAPSTTSRRWPSPRWPTCGPSCAGGAPTPRNGRRGKAPRCCVRRRRGGRPSRLPRTPPTAAAPRTAPRRARLREGRRPERPRNGLGAAHNCIFVQLFRSPPAPWTCPPSSPSWPTPPSTTPPARPAAASGATPRDGRGLGSHRGHRASATATRRTAAASRC